MQKIITASLCSLLVWLTTSCSLHPFDSASPADQTANQTGAQENPEILQAGKRNLWEANLTMALVTGAVSVDGSRMITATGNQRTQGTTNQHMQKINKTWNDVNGMMGTKNNVSGCDPATQVGVFKLASAYCNRLVNDNTAWNNFAEQNFGKTDISNLSKNKIVATMLDSLQAGSKLSNEQREKSITTIVNYLNDNGGEGDSVPKDMLFDVCTIVLGSASTTYN